MGGFRHQAGSARFAAWCAAAFVGVALAATLGWLRPADRALLRVGYVAAPCGVRQASAAVSIVFAGEASLLWGGIGAALLAWRRRPLLGVALLGLLLLTVPVELACKHLLHQPSPGLFIATLSRGSCLAPATAGAATQATAGAIPSAAAAAHQTLPSAAAGQAAYLKIGSLPSGFTCRAAFFGVVLAAAIGGTRHRWRRLVLRVGIVAGVVALGASRVVIAWHWPSDVLAGMLLGICAGALFLALARWAERGDEGAAA